MFTRLGQCPLAHSTGCKWSILNNVREGGFGEFWPYLVAKLPLKKAQYPGNVEIWRDVVHRVAAEERQGGNQDEHHPSKRGRRDPGFAELFRALRSRSR